MVDLICSYGLTSPGQALDFALVVCDVLGHGKNRRAVDLLLETCAQETHLGQCLDRHLYSSGVGLMQIDKICFDDIQARIREKHRLAIQAAFGVDLAFVEYGHLAMSPLLSMIFARLRYKLIPDIIPATRVGRAEYWKTWYNTLLGAGHPVEYLENAERFVDVTFDPDHIQKHLRG